MITADDLIAFPYTRDMTEAGIQCACQALLHAYLPASSPGFQQLRGMVSQAAAELAFRRQLGSEGILYETIGVAPFTEPGRSAVVLGGRCFKVVSLPVLSKDFIRQVHKNSEALLEASVYVPAEEIVSDSFRGEDVFVFAFVTGLVTTTTADLQRARRAAQPEYLVHRLPAAWYMPAVMRPLGQLVLKAENPAPVSIQLAGQGKDRSYVSEELVLEPYVRTEAKQAYYTLPYLHACQPVQGRVGIHSPAVKLTHLIGQEDWENLWFYGMRVFLAGYITGAEFRQKSSLLPAGRRIFQEASTRQKNMALPVTNLHPLKELVEKARAWESR